METWETANGTFMMRVTARPEKALVGIPGANYVFESAAVGSDDWREIMTFRHDDQVDLPRDQIRFVDERVGYVFMGWMFAVTTDGGRNWSVWNAAKQLPNWRTNYRLIDDVRVDADGGGMMRLNTLDERQQGTELFTRDYGRQWTARRPG